MDSLTVSRGLDGRALKGNTDEAVDFSKRWYGAYTRTIITIHPETGKTQRCDFEPQDEAAMRACIEAAQGWLNVYFVANACKPGETSPTKDEMTGGHCLHLDADFKDFDCSAEELLAVIRLFTPPPSVIVFTGGGYQAVWIYDGTFVDKDWARRIEASNAAVARVIGAAPGCQNVNRLLRLPGTVNVLSATKRKAGRQPSLAYLVDADWELKWSYEHPVPRLPEGVADWVPRLLRAASPSRRRAQDSGDMDDDRPRDESRSAEAMRIGSRMAREGKSYEEFCAAVRDTPETADWYREKGIASGGRQLRRIWNKVNRDPEDPSRPMVRIKEGELPRVVDEAEAALIVTDRNVYRFGSKLVTVAWGEIRVSGGGKERALRLSPLGVPALLERFDLAARFAKWNATAGGYVPCHCPKDVAERYLSRDGKWRVPALLGVVTAPCLRSDGTVLDEPGYDPQTALLFDPLGADFPTILDRPGRKDAEEALRELKELIQGFDFVDEPSRSVALSGILTAVSRAALPTAPMHGFDAPVAGSGKSKLVDIASIIATGHKAAVIADGGGADEFEKRLAAALLGGDQIISLDNLEKPVGGQLLCQVLTQHAVVIRPFGKLENVVVPCLVMVFANGNNLTVIGDATRRSLVGRIDPKVERPELRKFEADPVRRAMEERPKLLISALTVLRAWRVADDGSHGSMPDPLGSFEEWSRRVRNALIWLGEADPVEVIENMRGDDPRLAEVRQMMAAWQKALCSNIGVTVREVIGAALRETITKDGHEISVRENPDLYAALCAITRDRERDKSLGWWLRRYRDRVITLEGLRYRFVRIEDKWLLDAMDEVPF